MQLIDGKATATAIKAQIAQEVENIVAGGGKRPHLAAVLVGHDGGSETYVKNKVIACEQCGFKSTLIRYEADVTEEELLAEKKSKLEKQKAKQEELQRRILEKKALIESAYKKVFTDGATVESTPHNIYVLLSYLNTQNWGMWNLPKMTIGYKCNQYDCDGKQATTIILDKPILYKGEMLSHFQVGAPRGHLTQYARLSFN